MATLPPISEITKKAKRFKSQLTTLQGLYETASSLDFSSERGIPSELAEWWLVAKYGVQSLSRFCEVLRTIPDTLTPKRTNELLVQFSGLSKEQVDYLVQYIPEQCPHLLEEPRPIPVVLAPPTNCCSYCDKQLVIHHNTKVGESGHRYELLCMKSQGGKRKVFAFIPPHILEWV